MQGVEVPCSAIFKTFPTDRGMCCAFNMKAADEIFRGKKYPDLVMSLQRFDKENRLVKYFKLLSLGGNTKKSWT